MSNENPHSGKELNLTVNNLLCALKENKHSNNKFHNYDYLKKTLKEIISHTL